MKRLDQDKTAVSVQKDVPVQVEINVNVLVMSLSGLATPVDAVWTGACNPANTVE